MRRHHVGDLARSLHLRRAMMRIRRHVTVLMVVLLGLTLGGTALLYLRYDELRTQLASSSLDEADRLDARIRSLIELPAGEVPSVATVSDPSKLRDQSFFVGAVEGDKLLIYTKAKRAIIYRPSDGKIINVGPVELDEERATRVSVQVAHGGAREPAISALEALRSAFTEIDVSEDVPAAKRDYYQSTAVIDLSGANAELANRIAEHLGGEVRDLPEGELEPDGVDILIITS